MVQLQTKYFVYAFLMKKGSFMLLTLKMLSLEKEVLDSLRGSTRVFRTCSVKCSFVPESLFVVRGMNSFTQQMLINSSYCLPLVEQIGDEYAELECEIVSES